MKRDVTSLLSLCAVGVSFINPKFINGNYYLFVHELPSTKNGAA